MFQYGIMIQLRSWTRAHESFRGTVYIQPVSQLPSRTPVDLLLLLYFGEIRSNERPSTKFAGHTTDTCVHATKFVPIRSLTRLPLPRKPCKLICTQRNILRNASRAKDKHPQRNSKGIVSLNASFFYRKVTNSFGNNISFINEFFFIDRKNNQTLDRMFVSIAKYPVKNVVRICRTSFYARRSVDN